MLDSIKLPVNSNIKPYYSEGDFSMHQLIEHLINQMGEVSVVLSSFSITELAVRTFYRLIEQKKIKQISCLFDFTVKRHKVSLLFFISNVVKNIAIAKCHAKIVLLYNDKQFISVISSANLNINDKIEAGIISSNKQTFDFFYNKLTHSISKGIKINNDEFN